ncbi:uncharacterized protein LOC135843692 [Planococcus citri]|uniref:uncharacterized protein LOC135843692 n=1 Tax=Planococcus citri TaxID=170843 RepID=UPI0031F88026
MSDDQSPSDGTLVFYLHAGKLVDLAAISMLADLKHHKMTQIHRGNKEIDILCYEMDLISVTLPESITDMLRELSDRMDKPIAEWWRYHWDQVFLRKMPSDDMITLFDRLVWLPNGSISFEQTARKLLDSDKLTNVQKFQIACTYCFIDDVNRLKETLSPDEMHLATESLCTDVDPFLEYWCCKIRHVTGFRHLTNTNIHFFSELIQPIYRKYYSHWPVVEYFWKQSFDEEGRLKNAKEIIYTAYSGTPELIWHLLPKLSSSQLVWMMRENGYEIMLYFAREPKYIEYTMLTWKRVVNLINDDVLNCLLRSVTGMEADRDYVDRLLRRMWLCMSQQQKKFVANQQEFDYVAKWIDDCEFNSPNYQLIFEVFLLWDSERRHRHWKADWTRLVIGQMKHKNKIEEMMKIIFDSNENIAAFKRTVMTDYNSIRTVSELVLNWGLLQELQNYLNFCTEDQDVIRNLKKQIITSMPKDDLFYTLCDCCDDEVLDAEFKYFLRDIFAVDEIKDFQKDVLIASLVKMEEMLRDGSVDQVIQCIEKYLSSEEDLFAIKLHFMKFSPNLFEIVGETIKMPEWVDFLSWCLDGNKSLIERFKISLQPTKVSGDVEMEQHSLYESFCSTFLCN